jgi:RNA polymerase sigma-70 factor (ECF subfamily)
VGIRGTDLRTLERDYDALDDRMLVLDFQAGHPEAFVEIHHRHGPLARRVCGRYLRNPQDADEAFQETMIRVYQGLHRFNGTYALRPWIARIATNVSIDAIRAHDRRPEFDDNEVEDHDHADPDDGPEAAYERLIERDLVISVLEELPETHRTALVLRELEGRSHKEIGHAMGISSAQAKALIHRAKGSFRRGWLRAVTDRGGLAGIAMLPLIVTIKVFDGARKVLDRVVGHAGQVVQAATPEVVSSAASSPTVTNAVTSVGERVVATGMAVLIAGSVTVGATQLAKHGDSKKDAKVVAAAAPSVRDEPAATVTVIAPKEEGPGRDGPKAETTEPVAGEEVLPSPTGTPAGETPSPGPSEGPPATPTGEPSPLPAPAWALGFDSTVDIGEPELAMESSKVVGSVSGGISFAQTVAGPTMLPGSAGPSHVYLEAFGEAGPGSSWVTLWLFLDTPDGGYRYEASGALSAVVADVDGTTTYTFEAAYHLKDGPSWEDGNEPTLQVPHDGLATLSLNFWSDGHSLVATDLSLVEAAP